VRSADAGQAFVGAPPPQEEIAMKKELQNKRAQLAVEMRAIFDKAKAESRGLNGDETEGWERRRAEIESIDATIDRLEKQDKIDAHGAQVVEIGNALAVVPNDPRKKTDARYDDAFAAYMRRGFSGLEPEEQAALAGRFIDADGRNIRAAQTVTTSGGGYLIPQGFSGQIDVAMKQYGGMLQAADTVTTETGNPLPWPTVNDTGNVGELLAVNTQAANQDFTFGQVTFGAYKFSSKVVLVPIELLQDSFFDLNSFLATNLGVRLGRILNTKLTVGAGSTEPNGIVTAATAGPVGATGETTSLIYDDLVALEHSIDPAYRASQSCRFMMADSTVKAIKLLKDGSGRPLWLPSFQAGFEGKFGDTILGYPYTVNQDVAVMAANAKSILFGDFSKYKIRRVMDFTLLRLTERYADFGQVGFLAFMRADGNLIDAGTHPVKYFANSAS